MMLSDVSIPLIKRSNEDGKGVGLRQPIFDFKDFGLNGRYDEWLTTLSARERKRRGLLQLPLDLTKIKD